MIILRLALVAQDAFGGLDSSFGNVRSRRMVVLGSG
jgi:hypothetical protein